MKVKFNEFNEQNGRIISKPVFGLSFVIEHNGGQWYNWRMEDEYGNETNLAQYSGGAETIEQAKEQINRIVQQDLSKFIE